MGCSSNTLLKVFNKLERNKVFCALFFLLSQWCYTVILSVLGLVFENLESKYLLLELVLFHHHHCLSPLSGYRPQTNLLHTSLSLAFLLRATHVIPTSFISLSMHLLHVSCGLPPPLEPSGFH